MFSTSPFTMAQASNGPLPIESASFQLAFGEPTNSRGGTACAVTNDGQALVLQLGTPSQALRSPFGAGVYGSAEENQKATRLNLEVDITGRHEIITKFREIDNQVVAWLKTCDKFKIKNPADSYRPIVIEDEKYGTTRVRFKMNVAGLNAARGWKFETRQRLEDLKTVNFRDCPSMLVFQVSKVWSMSRDVGCSLEVRHVVVMNDVDDEMPAFTGW